MFDNETGHRNFIEYEKYEVLKEEFQKELLKFKNRNIDYQELIKYIIDFIKNIIIEIEKLLEDIKKDLTKIEAD